MKKLKADLSEEEFEDYIDSEKIAYYCYNMIVKNKMNDYVDTIGNTKCFYNGDISKHIKAFFKAKLILQKDYNVDMYSLPFLKEYHKDEIRRYELVYLLEDYLIEKNIPFKKGKAYFKGQELSSIDSYIHSLIDEIDDIDCSLMVLKDPSI